MELKLITCDGNIVRHIEVNEDKIEISRIDPGCYLVWCKSSTGSVLCRNVIITK